MDMDRHRHGAPLLGIAPTGQKLEFDVIDLWTVRDGSSTSTGPVRLAARIRPAWRQGSTPALL